MLMQQPVLAQNSGSHAHDASDARHELFNSRLLHTEEVANGFQTPPRRFDTPSTPRALRRSKPPPLLVSLAENDLMKVRACLTADPTVASTPFWDHDVEPVLCAAVRLRCDACIVKVLLDSNADPEAIDLHGRTPLMIASSLCSELPEPGLLSVLFPDFPQPASNTQDRLLSAQASAEVLMERAVGLCTDLTPGIGAAGK
jgi:hypothetical protein